MKIIKRNTDITMMNRSMSFAKKQELYFKASNVMKNTIDITASETRPIKLSLTNLGFTKKGKIIGATASNIERITGKYMMLF